MGNEQDVSDQVTDERVAAMVNAGKAGATAEPTLEPEPTLAPEPAVEGTEAPAETSEGQPPKKADPELIAQLQAQIRELEEKNANITAMRSEATRRNQNAAQDRKAAEVALQRAEAALARQESQQNAIVHIVKNMDPDLARQFLASLPVDQPTGSYGMPSNPAAQNGGLIDQMQRQIDELKSNVSGFAFNVNYGQVAAAIERSVGSFPVFKDVEAMGELDEAVGNVMQRIVAMDKDEPGKVNPHDPRGLSTIVKAEVQREADRWKKRIEFTINRYRTQRQTLNAAAAAPSKGPSAGVRATPGESTNLPANMATKDKIDRWTKQFAAISKRPPVAEI